jgi:hypothetical protein
MNEQIRIEFEAADIVARIMSEMEDVLRLIARPCGLPVPALLDDPVLAPREQAAATPAA